jgi:hypothetical protein
MTVLGLSLILLAAVAWILVPLWRQRNEMPQGPNEADEIEASHRQLLLALQDLDFEFQTGKLSPEDHQTMRHRLQGEAVAVLQKLEQLRGPGDPEPPAGREA